MTVDTQAPGTRMLLLAFCAGMAACAPKTGAVVVSVPIAPPRAPVAELEAALAFDEKGRVAHAEVRESIPMLDAAALRCALQWEFTPALHKGRPVPCLAQGHVRFRLF